MAVLVLGASEVDAELADNVTEMVIAAVARRGRVEVAGKEEFRARLGVTSEQRAQDCLEECPPASGGPRCRWACGGSSPAPWAGGDRQFLFSLNLHDVAGGQDRKPGVPADRRQPR